MLISFALVIIAGSILSADAIKCYQCNSHVDPNCLALSIPKAVKSDEYLKECDENHVGQSAFCRKTEILIENSEEKRVVRSCGWISANKNRTAHCLSADNEGYLETICSCFTDTCNSQPLGFKPSFVLVTVSIVIFYLAGLF